MWRGKASVEEEVSDTLAGEDAPTTVVLEIRSWRRVG